MGTYTASVSETCQNNWNSIIEVKSYAQWTFLKKNLGQVAKILSNQALEIKTRSFWTQSHSYELRKWSSYFIASWVEPRFELYRHMCLCRHRDKFLSTCRQEKNILTTALIQTIQDFMQKKNLCCQRIWNCNFTWLGYLYKNSAISWYMIFHNR